MFRRSGRKRIPDQKQVFDYACWLLARRSYSQAELLKKFHSRFVVDTTIFAAALQKLVQLGFQSDENFTEGFVRSHPAWGRQRLCLELNKRGIPASLAEVFLPGEDAETERCRIALQTRLRNQDVPESYIEKQKIIAFLLRRGFALDVIKKILAI